MRSFRNRFTNSTETALLRVEFYRDEPEGNLWIDKIRLLESPTPKEGETIAARKARELDAAQSVLDDHEALGLFEGDVFGGWLKVDQLQSLIVKGRVWWARYNTVDGEDHDCGFNVEEIVSFEPLPEVVAAWQRAMMFVSAPRRSVMSEEKEAEYIKIRYERGERGWAEDMGGGKARIANVPLRADLGFNDVVTLKEDEDGWLIVDKIIERSLPQKVAVYYTDRDAIMAFKQAINERGWGCEPGIAPTSDRPGLALISAPANANVAAIGKKISENLVFKKPE